MIRWYAPGSAALRLCLCALAGILLLSPPASEAGEEGAELERDILRLEGLGRVFGAVYRQGSPAVVLINTTAHNLFAHLPRPHPRLPDRWFEQEFRGLGSGTLVSEDGYILSNFHVVEGADSIRVTLFDRRTFAAQVVGFDSLIDIALLKIEARGLPTIHLGDSDRVEVGDWVVAIGHPLGLGSTLTHGIVSALGREADVIEAPYSIESFIQTNAVINPGNSGGPLLNLHGEAIGINTAISTRTGYFIGYGLAVPSNLAREAMRDILAQGHVVRGYLGVKMEEVEQEHIERYDLALERPRGVYLSEVGAGTPAERAGLHSGDVILELAGRKVDHPNQVQTMIYARNPGERIDLEVLRQGEVLHFEVLLGEREEDQRLARGRRRLGQLGLEVEELSAEMAAELGFTGAVAAELGFGEGEEAVVVVALDPEGPAAAKGIEVHDLITEIDQERITSLHQLLHSVSELEEDKAALFWLWQRDKGIDVRALRLPAE